MVAVTLTVYLLQIISVIMIGQLSELAHSSTSLLSLFAVSPALVSWPITSSLFFWNHSQSLLGAGNQQRAKVADFAGTLLAVTEAFVFSGALFAGRHVFSYTFSNDKEVVDYVTDMAPLICPSICMDSVQGVARGCGWRHLGAYVNLAAFYLFGISKGIILGFWVQLRVKGLRIGVLAGATLQANLLCIITICTNWEKQATMARGRGCCTKTDEGNIL